MDVEFVILCPNRNIGGAKNSVGSVRCHSRGREAICVVPDDTTEREAEMLSPTRVVRGGGTQTGLINAGMRECRGEWAFLFFAGSRLPHYIERKLENWASDPGDVLFPVVDRKTNFVDGSFNGVLINKATFLEVGEFPEISGSKQGFNDFELAKLLWAVRATESGCRFKAIVGMRVI